MDPATHMSMLISINSLSKGQSDEKKKEKKKDYKGEYPPPGKLYTKEQWEDKKSIAYDTSEQEMARAKRWRQAMKDKQKNEDAANRRIGIEKGWIKDEK